MFVGMTAVNPIMIAMRYDHQPDYTVSKLNGGTDFVGVGNNGDRIRIKTNSNNTAAYEISRSNF